MKSVPFILAFIVLWFTDYYLAGWFYPNFETDHIAWDNFVLFRESIYELSYFLILFLGVVKHNRLSKALSVFALVLVGSSIIDKQIHLQTTYAYYDPIVILFGIFFATFIYRHGRN
jgi:hypothetical protein